MLLLYHQITLSPVFTGCLLAMCMGTSPFTKYIHPAMPLQAWPPMESTKSGQAGFMA
jgi:hypothetical protein